MKNMYVAMSGCKYSRNYMDDFYIPHFPTEIYSLITLAGRGVKGILECIVYLQCIYDKIWNGHHCIWLVKEVI